VIEKLVALTGIEPAGRQFSSVQLGLSSCVFGLVHYATRAFRALRKPDVLPRSCPAAKIRFLAALPVKVNCRLQEKLPRADHTSGHLFNT
jgi:hypothetical protein